LQPAFFCCDFFVPFVKILYFTVFSQGKTKFLPFFLFSKGQNRFCLHAIRLLKITFAIFSPLLFCLQIFVFFSKPKFMT